MLKILAKTTSLKNLSKANTSGQVATIMILITAVIIIFVLVTMNLGHVASRTTKVANAADSAGFLLGSLLSSQVKYYYEALDGETKVCVRGGILPAVLAVVTAVVCLFIPGMQWYSIVALSAAAGFIGGYITTGTLKGAAIGAVTGAVIGLTIFGGAQIGAAIGVGGAPLANVASIFAAGEVMAMSTGFIVGMIAGAAIVGGIAVYNAGQNRMIMPSPPSVTKMMQNLPEYESARENVLYKALLEAVDDPMETDPGATVTCGKFSSGGGYDVSGGDPEDLDQDGITNEKQSCLSYWWYYHIKDLQETIIDRKDDIEDFFDDYLIDFYEHVTNRDVTDDDPLGFLWQMDRSEVECNCKKAGGAEAPLTHLLRRLEGCPSYNMTFWDPGPTRAELIAAYECATCQQIPNDEYDRVRYLYDSFTNWAVDILEPDECGFYQYDLKKLSNKLRNRSNDDPNASEDEMDIDWFDDMYNIFKNSNDYHDAFFDDKKGVYPAIESWIDEIKDKRDRLPGCQLLYGATTLKNPYLSDDLSCEGEMEFDDIDSIADFSAFTFGMDDIDVVIFPCRWMMDTVDIDGPHFPNSPCKLYDQGAQLLNEITTVENFVINEQNLEDWIRNTYYSNPCGMGCTLFPNAGALPGDPLVIIDIQWVQLDGDIHAECSHQPTNPARGILRVNFNYKYTCQCPVYASCATSGCAGSCASFTCDCICPTGVACNLCAGSCSESPDPNDPNAIIAACSCAIPWGANNICDYLYPVSQGNTTLGIPIAAGDLETPITDVDGLLAYMQEFRDFIYTGDIQDIDADGYGFATIDQDTYDEFKPALEILETELLWLDYFRPGAVELYDKLKLDENRAQDGAGSIEYGWETGEGKHWVRAETGAFKFPYLHESKSGGDLMYKKCVEIKRKNDKWGKGDKTWVEITRKFPGEKTLKSSGSVDLGLKWNPTYKEDSEGYGITVKRKCKVHYTHDFVGVRDIQ